MSAIFRRVKIPSESIPASGGFTGFAPGESNNLSYVSVYVSFFEVRTVTSFFSESIAITSDRTRAERLNRCANDSGVCKNRLSRSEITPPI